MKGLDEKFGASAPHGRDRAAGRVGVAEHDDGPFKVFAADAGQKGGGRFGESVQFQGQKDQVPRRPGQQVADMRIRSGDGSSHAAAGQDLQKDLGRAGVRIDNQDLADQHVRNCWGHIRTVSGVLRVWLVGTMRYSCSGRGQPWPSPIRGNRR